MTEEIQPGAFYVKDGSQRRVVKVIAVNDDVVTFSWMGIAFTKEKKEFCRHYTYITVPDMGNVK